MNKDQCKGVFDLMDIKGLTTLEIFQTINGKFLYRGSKEWDDDRKFSSYNSDFRYYAILTEHYKAVGKDILVEYFRELDLNDHIERIEQLMRNAGHEGIDFFYNRNKNVRIAYCKHNPTFGPKNQQHAIRAGAMRRHELHENEIDVLIDGLNLSRAMTYKNIMGCLPYGGCKTVMQCAPVKLDDFETIGFISYVTDRCRNFPGADMGLEEAMVDIIREKYTKNYIGGTKSPLVTTGMPTAYGEYLAIKEACDFVYGTKDLSSRTIAVQGLGHVGYPLVEYLLKDGAKVTVTDIDANKVKDLQQKYDQKLKYVSPDEIYTVDADVFSPCAMGGVITEERIPRFKFKIIVGAANNQLKATDKENEIRLAKKLADAGIIFVVDWAHNTGGVIAAAMLWQLQDLLTEEQLKPKIELPCRNNFRMLLNESKKTGLTPTELAYKKVDDIIRSGSLSTIS